MFNYSSQTIIYIVSYILILVLCFLISYRQELIFTLEFRKVKHFLNKLGKMENSLKELFEKEFARFAPPDRVKQIYEQVSNFFVILPEESDPVGSVRRLKHILESVREQIEKEVSLFTAIDNEEDKSTMKQVFIELSRLGRIHKLVKHLYITGSKSKNLAGLIQALFQLPFLELTAERCFNILKCYLQEPKKPIGYGIGPLVAKSLMKNAERIDVRKGGVVAEKTLNGKRVIIVRPKGPGARTEEDVSEVLLEEVRKCKNPSIILISAQPKLKGENGVKVVQGVGVAAVYEPLKFELESIASRKKLSLISVLVKLSDKELSSKINDHSNFIIAETLTTVEELVKKLPEPIIIVGLGNSFMIP
ncbi:MAG: DUF1512 family protein [Candidatus Jordarchaeales archaeon]